MDRESPELIEREMHETRQSLTDKVAALEHQVAGTFDHAAHTVQDTVQSMRAAVSDTMNSVTDKVKESVNTVQDSVSQVKASLDIRDQIREQPWAVMAGAAISGIVAGYMFGPGRNRSSSSRSTVSRPSSSSPIHEPAMAQSAYKPAAPSKPGIMDELMDRVRREIATLSETAIATLSNSLKTTLNDSIQHLVKNTLTIPTASQSASNMSADDRDTEYRRRNGIACDTAH